MKTTRMHRISRTAMICGLALSTTAFADHMAGADHEFTAMDTNGDGRISADEHATGAKRMFETMDADHDGGVTAAEMTAAHDKMMANKSREAKPTEAKPMEAKPMHTEMSAAEKIKVIDTDGDGVVTAAEHAAGSKSMFERMDTDKDGFLSKAELAAGHAKMMHEPA